MILRHRAALNGIQLDEIEPRILCTGIEEPDPREQIALTTVWGGDGSRVTGKRHRDSVDIIIRAAIREHSWEMQARSELTEKLNGWAAIADGETGAWLTIGHRENRRIRVILAQPPAGKDQKNWTQEYAITLRAPWVPYWEETTPGAAWQSGVAGSGSGGMAVGGTAETVCDCELNNQSGMEISTATITAGGKTMTFTGLGLGANESLVIDHSETGLLQIRIRSAGGAWRSAMSKRTTGSANDLKIRPGAVSVGFSAQRACRASFTARGRFL